MPLPDPAGYRMRPMWAPDPVFPGPVKYRPLEHISPIKRPQPVLNPTCTRWGVPMTWVPTSRFLAPLSETSPSHRTRVAAALATNSGTPSFTTTAPNRLPPAMQTQQQQTLKKVTIVTDTDRVQQQSDQEPEAKEEVLSAPQPPSAEEGDSSVPPQDTVTAAVVEAKPVPKAAAPKARRRDERGLQTSNIKFYESPAEQKALADKQRRSLYFKKTQLPPALDVMNPFHDIVAPADAQDTKEIRLAYEKVCKANPTAAPLKDCQLAYSDLPNLIESMGIPFSSEDIALVAAETGKNDKNWSAKIDIDTIARVWPAVKAKQERNLKEGIPQKVAALVSELRTNSSTIVGPLKERRKLFSGKAYTLPGSSQPILTREGPKAVEECIAVMAGTGRLPALKLSPALCRAAEVHAVDIGAKGKTGHQGSDASMPGQRMGRFGTVNGKVAENISYGCRTALHCVLQLLIDDGLLQRPHRANILDPQLTKIGVAFGPHATHGTVCVMTFADDDFVEAAASGGGGLTSIATTRGLPSQSHLSGGSRLQQFVRWRLAKRLVKALIKENMLEKEGLAEIFEVRGGAKKREMTFVEAFAHLSAKTQAQDSVAGVYQAMGGTSASHGGFMEIFTTYIPAKVQRQITKALTNERTTVRICVMPGQITVRIWGDGKVLSHVISTESA